MIHPGRRGRTFAVPAAFSRAAESACKKVVNLRQFVLESNSYRGPLRRLWRDKFFEKFGQDI
ncbi:hypothetical protein HMPREF1545_02893 [Oscillibacter sp. KLE 1728]|nr:hypothetical protein HMPREF1545_02893 [Oscillibacter sp. KLE 1728]ERK62380.1 hypothetical protein HMPREF1546_02767 [Oscillibacter sp. KLE 1745]